MSDDLMATVNIKLKADSGYESQQTERISSAQWGRICNILGEIQSGITSQTLLAKCESEGSGSCPPADKTEDQNPLFVATDKPLDRDVRATVGEEDEEFAKVQAAEEARVREVLEMSGFLHPDSFNRGILIAGRLRLPIERVNKRDWKLTTSLFGTTPEIHVAADKGKASHTEPRTDDGG